MFSPADKLQSSPNQNTTLCIKSHPTAAEEGGGSSDPNGALHVATDFLDAHGDESSSRRLFSMAR